MSRRSKRRAFRRWYLARHRPLEPFQIEGAFVHLWLLRLHAEQERLCASLGLSREQLEGKR